MCLQLWPKAANGYCVGNLSNCIYDGYYCTVMAVAIFEFRANNLFKVTNQSEAEVSPTPNTVGCGGKYVAPVGCGGKCVAPVGVVRNKMKISFIDCDVSFRPFSLTFVMFKFSLYCNKHCLTCRDM